MEVRKLDAVTVIYNQGVGNRLAGQTADIDVLDKIFRWVDRLVVRTMEAIAVTACIGIVTDRIGAVEKQVGRRFYVVSAEHAVDLHMRDRRGVGLVEVNARAVGRVRRDVNPEIREINPEYVRRGRRL